MCHVSGLILFKLLSKIVYKCSLTVTEYILKVCPRTLYACIYVCVCVHLSASMLKFSRRSVCSNSGVYVLSTVRKGMCVCARCINFPTHVYSSASETSLQCSSNSLHFDLWITQRAESGRKLTTHTQTHCRRQTLAMDTLNRYKYTDIHTEHALTADTF